jgi:hypothetical protein
MLGTTASAAETADDQLGFSDVSQGHWAYNQILALQAEDVISGYPDGTFRPSQALTRAQFASLVVEAYDLDTSGNEDTDIFRDVPQNHWAHEKIVAAAEEKFISGYANGTFKPDNTISREEALAVLQNDPDFPKDAPVDVDAQLGFLMDRDSISDWAEETVARMFKHDKLLNDQYIYHGTHHRYLAPQGKTTRAMAANFLYNMLENPRKPGDFVSGDIVTPAEHIEIYDGPSKESGTIGGVNSGAVGIVRWGVDDSNSNNWAQVLFVGSEQIDSLLGFVDASKLDLRTPAATDGQKIWATDELSRTELDEIRVYEGTAAATVAGTVEVGAEGTVIGPETEHDSATIVNHGGLWYEVDFGSVQGYVSANRVAREIPDTATATQSTGSGSQDLIDRLF